MNENVPSEIIDKFQAKFDWMKQRGYYVGDPAEPGIYRTLDGGWQCNYEGWCAIVIRPGETEPHEIHGAIGQRWYREWGAFDISGKRGSLGHPISDEEIYEGDGDPNDRVSHFENGDVIWTAKTDETRIVNIKDRARWYKAKHDQLLDLLRRAVEAPAPERHNEALKAVEDKCKEDQFDVVLLGEFQSGKSTTFDIFCGGREVSPQGNGTTPTSAVPVSVQALSSGESEEWGEIRFKSKRELAGELFDAFELELIGEETPHPLRAFLPAGDGAARDCFCDAFDYGDPAHLSTARRALEEAWHRYHESEASKSRFSTRQRQLMEVASLVVRFHDSPEFAALGEAARCPVDAVGGYVWFPADWQQNASLGFSYDVSPEDARFAFVERVILHLRSPFLDQLGCRVTDCPGLDASAYDKEVTRRALLRADGVLFFHKCQKMIGASALGELFEFVKNNNRTDRTVLALNLWGISRDAAIKPHVDRRGRQTPSLIDASIQQISGDGYSFPIVWCHVLVAYLAALGEKRIRDDVPFSEDERRWLAEKSGIEDDGRTDAVLWTEAVAETNHLFRIPQLDAITTLDKDAVDALWKATNFDSLLGAVSETVLREKTGSILVDNGSRKAFEILQSHETELQLKEDEAKRSANECAAEVEAALKALEKYIAESKTVLEDSYLVRYRDDVAESLSTQLLSDVLSEDFYGLLATRLGRVVHNLNSKLVGISRSDYAARFRAEVTPIVTDCFVSRSTNTLANWAVNPSGRFKTLVTDNADLANKIDELGQRYLRKRILEVQPPPAVPNLASADIGAFMRKNDSLFNDIAESLRAGFFTGLLKAFIFLAGGFIKTIWDSITKTKQEQEERAVANLAESIRPDLVRLFEDHSLREKIRVSFTPSFKNFFGEVLRSIESSRAAYEKKIREFCDELIAAHAAADEEAERIAEECRKLREECIAPLRAEVAAFETTVKTALP